MKKLANTLALGASAFALLHATPSLAEDKVPVASVTTTTSAPSPVVGSEIYFDRVERRVPNPTLLWTGVTVFTATYAGSVVGGAVAGDRIPDKNLFIPLVGPWLDLGQRNCDFRRCDDREETGWQALIIASGIAQGAGAILALSSFFVPQTRTTSRRGVQARPELHFAPVSYAGGAGIGAGGRF